MIVIRNSSVDPDRMNDLPGSITVRALIETSTPIDTDRMVIRATLLTPGYIFQGLGPAAVIPASELAPTLFDVSDTLTVTRSVASPPFFEVMVVAERLSGPQVVDASSPRNDSVLVGA